MDNEKVYTHAVIADIFYEKNGIKKRTDELYYCTSLAEAQQLGLHWAMTGRTNVGIIELKNYDLNKKQELTA